MKESVEQCNVCKKEYTSTHVEVMHGTVVYVCQKCIKKAKDNFIWVCMKCGKSYIRPKQLVIKRVKDYELKRAYMLCEDMLIIQGIDMCITCSPERIVEYIETHQAAMEC
jgi:hypothetical protein